MAQIKLTIKNWDKYQKRTDYKKPWWFSFNNQFWKAEKYSQMTHEQRWAWICILSHASEQKCNGTTVFNDDWLCRVGNISKQALYLCIETLIKTDTLDAEFETCTESVQKKDENCVHTINNNNNNIQYTKNNSLLISTEPKQALVTVPTGNKKDLSLFINEKLLELYPQEYLDREKAKMEIWLAANSHKKPRSDRGMVRFVTGWLSRSWDQYRKSLQSNAPKERSFAEVWAEEEKRRQEEGGY